jgi:hypothetical protein
LRRSKRRTRNETGARIDPADDPQAAARVLAEIMDGEAMCFPPGGPDAWMAWSGDAAIELEIVRRGRVLHRDDDQGNWRAAGEGQSLSEVHLAIAVERTAEDIARIAAEAGWPARLCARGGGIFELVEVWVEGSFMIEFLDPQQAAHYERAVTPQAWKNFLEQMQAA